MNELGSKALGNARKTAPAIRDLSRKTLAELLAPSGPVRTGYTENRTKAEIYDSSQSCRARAASLRLLAEQLTLPDMKAKLLELAKAWDERADAYDRFYS